MTRGNKIVIAVVTIVVIAALAILFWWLFLRPPETVVRTIPSDPVPAANPPVLPVEDSGFDREIEEPEAEPAEEEAAANGKAAARAAATSFAERFGSYSTEGDFENVTDLYPAMTSSVRAWAEGYVASQRAAGVSDSFAGTTTRALNVNFGSSDVASGVAEVEVLTQRREVSTVSGERVYYQTLELTLVEQDGSWLIDFVRWQKAS